MKLKKKISNTEWELTKYFYKSLEDKNISKDTKLIISLTDKFLNKYKNQIKNLKAKDYIKFFNDENNISKNINKISYYLFLLSSKNTQDQNILKKLAEFENITRDISNKLLFISQEFKELEYNKLIKLSENKELIKYKNYFVQKANTSKYILSEKEEYILNMKENSGGSAFQSLYEELTNSFIFKININEENKKLTRDELSSLIKSSDEKIRKKAIISLRKIYSKKNIQITLAKTYSSIVKDSVSEIKIRNFDNVMSIRNISEELDTKTVNMLLEEIEKAYPLFQKYLKIKTKLLGKNKLNIWDLHAPISKKKINIEFNEGKNIFLEIINKFDKEFYEYSKSMFDQSRVDVFPKKNKISGAFAAYDKNIPSFVLLNYTNQLNDISTIAHEIGHATHGYFMQKQKEEVFSPGLCLQETASIFNELLLSKELKKKLNKNEKINFIEENLSETFSTIFKQIQYILFEKEVHNQILNGKELSSKDLNNLYRKEQIKLSGEKYIKYDTKAEDEIGWSVIPHIFYTPFYCYSYAFGNILSFSLYKLYLEKGDIFIKDYKNILSAGGSETPYNLLIKYGIDINSKKFYQDGIKVIEEMINELEELIE